MSVYTPALQLDEANYTVFNADESGTTWRDKLSLDFMIKCADPSPWGKAWGLNFRNDLNAPVMFDLVPFDEFMRQHREPAKLHRYLDDGHFFASGHCRNAWCVFLDQKPPENLLVYVLL